MPNEVDRAAGPVVEQFAAPAGRVLGYIAAGAGLLLAVGASLSDFATNRGLVLFGIATACLAWVVLIRPVVFAHEGGVVLRNMARDVFVPWSCIERTRVLQTLQVVTPQATYHGLGVTRSARSIMKEARRGSGPTPPVFGAGGAIFGRGYTPRDAELRAAQRAGGNYQSYVESRLQDLGTQRAAKDSAGNRPLVSWAVLPVAALLVAALCVVLLVLL